uniref:LAGLIDADG endonuclease n=1 Tax=Juglanconis juglandina TaxID=1940567 RepID=A0A291LIR5_9PEZI|nr:hypothetical protein [Juglanconis juglandina]
MLMLIFINTLLFCILSDEAWLYLKRYSNKTIKRQPPFSRWTAHLRLILFQRCLDADYPLYFRKLTSILPYHESLPVPQTVLPRLLGWSTFKAFLQFDGL